MIADVALDSNDALGEGPVWLAESQELLRVDITQGLLLTWSPETGRQIAQRFERDTSAAAPRVRGGFIVAVEHDLVLVDGDGARTVLATVEGDRPGNRFNDCRVDPRGRLWAGTMSRERQPGAAALYRVDPDGTVKPVILGTTLSNGIGWSPTGDRMYFVDSVQQRIDVLSFDAGSGTPAHRRAFVTIPAVDGLPDGLAVDAEGGVWVALFGGAAVRRYDPAGNLSEVVTLPTANPTCPCFGGPDLSTLFVTTARHRLSDSELAEQPLAGAVFAADAGVQGVLSTPFAG